MCDYLNMTLDTFGETMKKHGEVWIVVKKQCMRKMAAQDNLVACNEDRVRISTEEVASFHTIVAKVLYVSKKAILDTSPSAASLTTSVKPPILMIRRR